MSDSDDTWHICFLWEIVFTKLCKWLYEVFLNWSVSNLVFISKNKNLLKKMKVVNSADTFYSEVIEEFVKKKQRIECAN